MSQSDSKLNHLSERQISQLRSTFELIDKDQDGVISKEDLRSAIKYTGQVPDEKELEDMVKDVVGFPAFMIIMSRHIAQQELGTALRDALETLKDSNGKITMDSLEELYKREGDEIKKTLEQFTKQDAITGEKEFHSEKFIKMMEY